MAGQTVLNILTDSNISMPDLDIATPYTNALRWLNVVHKDLINEFRLVTTSVDITLDTTNRDYALDKGDVTIWSAEYRSSSTNIPIPLIATSVDELDESYGGWRNSLQGFPQMYYEYQDSNGAQIIGFDRIPQTATSAGYPTVRVYVSVYTALASGDTIPESVKNADIYVVGLCREFARKKHREEYSFWDAEYQRLKNELEMFIQRKQRRNPPRSMPMLNTGVSYS